jgi:hypothetical protein
MNTSGRWPPAKTKRNLFEGLPRICPTPPGNMRTSMKDQATVQQFIGQRAQGVSSRAIAQQLQLAMRTRPPHSRRFLCRWRPVEVVPPKFRNGLTKMKNVPVLFSFVQFPWPRTDVHPDFGPVLRTTSGQGRPRSRRDLCSYAGGNTPGDAPFLTCIVLRIYTYCFLPLAGRYERFFDI